MLRVASLLLLSFALLACSSVKEQTVGSVEIIRIDPAYMEDQDFKHISEYLTGVEEHGKRTVVRTQPDLRAGFYFTLKLDAKAKQLPRGSRVVGEFYLPQSAEAQIFDLTLPAERGKSNELLFGLTGSDWLQGKERAPAAWRFTIKDADGQILGTAHSFLWNKH
jgi:hypothetical protein